MDSITNVFATISNPAMWLLGLSIIFLVFLLLREFLCWYWKINRIVELLENINQNLGRKDQKISESVPGQQVPSKNTPY